MRRDERRELGYRVVGKKGAIQSNLTTTMIKYNKRAVVHDASSSQVRQRGSPECLSQLCAPASERIKARIMITWA